jgi:hypothetical protein
MESGAECSGGGGTGAWLIVCDAMLFCSLFMRARFGRSMFTSSKVFHGLVDWTGLDLIGGTSSRTSTTTLYFLSSTLLLSGSCFETLIRA